MKTDEYDWIDDAFDDTKQDPLALKGMTGCSSLGALFALIGVIVIVVILIVVANMAFGTFAA